MLGNDIQHAEINLLRMEMGSADAFDNLHYLHANVSRNMFYMFVLVSKPSSRIRLVCI